MRKISFLIFAAATFGLYPARAVTSQPNELIVQIDGVNTLKVEIPDGYCSVPNGPEEIDKILFEAQEKLQAGYTKLGAFLLDCDSYHAAKRGEIVPSRYWALILLSLNPPNKTPEPLLGYDRPEVLDKMEETYSGDFRDTVAGLAPTLSERLADVCGNSDCKVDRVSSLGVIARDEAAVYLGLLAATKFDGKPQTNIGVSALSLVKQYVVGVTYYRPFVDEESVKVAQKLAHHSMVSLISLNESEASRLGAYSEDASALAPRQSRVPYKASSSDFDWGRFFGKILGGAIIGAIIFGIAGAFRRSKHPPTE